MADDVTIKIRRDEAIVLFEWLARLDTFEKRAFEHPAEEKVLWCIEGQLESTLVEPLMANYKAILAEARKSVEGV